MLASRKERQDPIGTSKENEEGHRAPGLRAFRIMSSGRKDDEENRSAHGNAMAAGDVAMASTGSSSAMDAGTDSATWNTTEWRGRTSSKKDSGDGRSREQ